jgi:serine/threonine-protein kinase
MTPEAADLTEEGRAFFQSRVALFAKVMIGTQLLGMFGLIAQNPWERIWQPWFALYQVQTALAVGAWLVCRRGVRSARFVAALDATVLLGLAVVSASISRLLMPDFLGEYLGGAVTPDDAAYAHVVARFQGSIGLTFVIGLSLWVFARAALVPSRPLRTTVLTALVGVPLALVIILPTFPFEAEPSLRSVMPEPVVQQNALDVVVWWPFITLVCAIVSRVTFGLREQIREARRLGQYTLEAKLGEGGMGAVYRASHAMMRRPTAIKLVPSDQAGETNLARFEREVQLTARLSHPNTVTIFDYGRTPDGVFYYAMELLDGATLDEIVRVDGPQPAGRVLKVLVELTSALEEAHDIGLIHRDIKPSNVMVCSQGGKPDVAKLLDFGLVKEVDQEGDVELTKESALTGTPQYMCPEALTSPDDVDARGDLYALGAVGYFMLTGKPVFEGSTLVEVCSHHLHSEPEPPSKKLGTPLPDDVEALLLDCLHKEPADRPESAAELSKRLQACESMGEWTEPMARDWWDRHGESVRTVHEERGDSSTMAIAIDLART